MKEIWREGERCRYRRLALLHHPDKHKEEDKETAEKKFKQIAQAYELLSDGEWTRTEGRGPLAEKKRAELERSERRHTRPFAHDHLFRSPFDVFADFFGPRDPFSESFFEDFAFPSDSFFFSKPRRSTPSSRIHIFYDADKPDEKNW